MWNRLFANRTDAGRALAERLRRFEGEDVVILGLPRGGVPVAYEVAKELAAPLDVIVVRKLGVPLQPELGMGAIGENGVRIINRDIVEMARVSEEQLAAVERRERDELERRARRFRGERPRISLAGRIAIVIDDGIATGSTARAAGRIARAQGAATVVLAVPVAPPGWTIRAGEDADEFVSLETPAGFFAIGQFYEDFTQTSDETVIDCLERHAHEMTQASDPASNSSEVEIPVGAVSLPGRLTIPDQALGLVVFAHGSGSSRHSPRNQYVAHVLNDAGFGTLLFDLLTAREESDRANVFDIELLAQRLTGVADWLATQPTIATLRVGYFGASTGAAAALWAAAEPQTPVAAVVSRGGRPDLAMETLGAVVAPTRLIVGSLDHVVLDLNEKALAELRSESDLVVIEGATHLFEEPGTLDEAAASARDWFIRHLRPPSPEPARRSNPAATHLDPRLERAREDAEGVDSFEDPYADEAVRAQREEAQGTEVFVNPDDVIPATALRGGSPGHESLEAVVEPNGDEEAAREEPREY